MNKISLIILWIILILLLLLSIEYLFMGEVLATMVMLSMSILIIYIIFTKPTLSYIYKKSLGISMIILFFITIVSVYTKNNDQTNIATDTFANSTKVTISNSKQINAIQNMTKINIDSEIINRSKVRIDTKNNSQTNIITDTSINSVKVTTSNITQINTIQNMTEVNNNSKTINNSTQTDIMNTIQANNSTDLTDSIYYDKLQLLYIQIQPSLKYEEVLELIKHSELPYSEYKYLYGVKNIIVAFEKDVTLEPDRAKKGDYLKIGFDTSTKRKKHENDIITISTMVYFNNEKRIKLIEHASGNYFSLGRNDTGLYVDNYNYSDYKHNNMPFNSKEEQIYYLLKYKK